MSIIEHFTYQAARRELRAALDSFRPGNMVFLVGPSGAGKTTLRHAVMQEMFGSPIYWGSGRIPAIEVMSMLPNNAYFSSRELAKSFLGELEAPDLHWLFNANSAIAPSVKEQIEKEIQQARTIWTQLRRHSVTEGDYWNAIQTFLPARGCKLASIEQANSLLKNRGNTLPADHTLHLLGLAEKSEIMLLMTGVTECQELWAVHHELLRRVTVVWFRPYSPKRKGDYQQYLRLLKTISAQYPLCREDLLYIMANELMAATGGLLGHLVKILTNAQVKAKAGNSKTINKRHIEDSFYSDKDLANLWKDVHEFETISRPADVRELSALVEAEWLK